MFYLDLTSFPHSHKCRCWLKSCKHYEAGPEKEPGAQTLEMLARLKPIPKNGSFFLCPGMHHGGSHCFAEGATRQQPCKMIQGSQHFTTITRMFLKKIETIVLVAPALVTGIGPRLKAATNTSGF